MFTNALCRYHHLAGLFFRYSANRGLPEEYMMYSYVVARGAPCDSEEETPKFLEIHLFNEEVSRLITSRCMIVMNERGMTYGLWEFYGWYQSHMYCRTWAIYTDTYTHCLASPGQSVNRGLIPSYPVVSVYVTLFGSNEGVCATRTGSNKSWLSFWPLHITGRTCLETSNIRCYLTTEWEIARFKGNNDSCAVTILVDQMPLAKRPIYTCAALLKITRSLNKICLTRWYIVCQIEKPRKRWFRSSDRLPDIEVGDLYWANWAVPRSLFGAECLKMSTADGVPEASQRYCHTQSVMTHDSGVDMNGDGRTVSKINFTYTYPTAQSRSAYSPALIKITNSSF